MKRKLGKLKWQVKNAQALCAAVHQVVFNLTKHTRSIISNYSVAREPKQITDLYFGDPARRSVN